MNAEATARLSGSAAAARRFRSVLLVWAAVPPATALGLVDVRLLYDPGVVFSLGVSFGGSPVT